MVAIRDQEWIKLALFIFSNDVILKVSACDTGIYGTLLRVLKRGESSYQRGETSCAEHAEWRILHHPKKGHTAYSCCVGLKLNSYAFTCTAFSSYNSFSTRHYGYFYTLAWPCKLELSKMRPTLVGGVRPYQSQ